MHSVCTSEPAAHRTRTQPWGAEQSSSFLEREEERTKEVERERERETKWEKERKS